MRLIKLTCNYLNLPNSCKYFFVLGLASLTSTSFTACTRTSERIVIHNEATGKGNGGNRLVLSRSAVESILQNLKPRLTIVFEALRLLALTEKRVPGSTDLHAQPQLLKNLLLMFDSDAPALKDLATENNFKTQEEACIDFRGVKNASSTNLGQVGGAVCFSIQEIRKSAIKNFDRASEIFVLALATHEFLHHFVLVDDHELAEKAARDIQSFVEQQLVHHLEIVNKLTVSAQETRYLEQFFESALQLSETAMSQEKQP